MTATKNVKVAVTPEDRALFIMLFRLPERVHTRVHQGERDNDEEMQRIARHRQSEAPIAVGVVAALESLERLLALDEPAEAIVKAAFPLVASIRTALSSLPANGEADEWEGPLTDEEQAMIDGAWEKHKAAASCTIPPPGWHCTRAPGHEGPCAAVPLGNGG